MIDRVLSRPLEMKSKTFMFITNLICNKLTECINVISTDYDRKFDASANLSLIFLYFIYYRDKNIHVVRNCLNWNFTRKEWLHVFNYHCSLLVNGEKSRIFTHIWLWSAKLGSQLGLNQSQTWCETRIYLPILVRCHISIPPEYFSVLLFFLLESWNWKSEKRYQTSNYKMWDLKYILL